MDFGSSCLIGHTGFVGQTLARQHRFDSAFNSGTIDGAAGQSFDTVVCAAAPGSMFEANRNPDRDAARVQKLAEQIGRIGAGRFVLISTIAVLADLDGPDETTDNFETALAYGRNRRWLEQFIAEHFADALVVRLPALFGPGLKKNFLFDIFNPVPSMLPDARHAAMREALGDEVAGYYRHDNGLGMWVLDRERFDASPQRSVLEAEAVAAGFSAVGFAHPDSRYQYYDMARLWADIARCAEAGLDLVHLAPEPVAAATVHELLTGSPMPPSQAPVRSEDMRTRHAALWGHHGGYIATAEEVLAALARFGAGMRAP